MRYSYLFCKITARYCGKFYSDNFSDKLDEYLLLYPGFVDYSDNINDAYFVVDLYSSFEFDLLNGTSGSKVYIQVNNLFDNLYSAYAIGKEFFPAADRNLIAGLQIGL